MVIGVISDTHGRLTQSSLEALKGSEAILHAGDVGSPEVIKALEEIAPVYAVRGNSDRGMWAQSLPMSQLVELEDKFFFIVHDIYSMSIDAKSAGIDVVVYGHSHVPKEDRQGGVLYFNPGSAGPKRFKLPVCLGRIILTGGEIKVEWVELK